MKTRKKRVAKKTRRFMSFHEENPEVWEAFVRHTFQLIDVGATRYSADAVVHRIRWERDLRNQFLAFPVGKSKINNDYVAHYARMFMDTFPQHSGFFRLRKATV